MVNVKETFSDFQGTANQEKLSEKGEELSEKAQYQIRRIVLLNRRLALQPADMNTAMKSGADPEPTNGFCCIHEATKAVGCFSSTFRIRILY